MGKMKHFTDLMNRVSVHYFILLLIVVPVLNSFSNNISYKLKMSETIEKLEHATTINEFVSLANSFENISCNFQNKWLPFYYASYSYIRISYIIEDVEEKKIYLDKAQNHLDSAFIIVPDESELYALQAFLYPLRIDPSKQWEAYSYKRKIFRNLKDAINLNPENPRSYYIKAVTLLNMPKVVGGGKKRAKPIFEVAKLKFDEYKKKIGYLSELGQRTE